MQAFSGTFTPEKAFAFCIKDNALIDLIIGNPPWIMLGWNEQDVLSDKQPMFAIKNLSAAQTTEHREKTLRDVPTRKLYFSEYESMSGEQNFLNAVQNYPLLVGMKANLYKCFLPLAWEKNNERGVSAFVHPEGVYDDPKGGALREKLYPRLRYHFQYTNERKLFAEVHHNTVFSLNVYGGTHPVLFDTIGNLYDVKTIEECYDGDASAPIPGIKDENGEWNIKGHPDRIIQITKKELAVFAKLFDGSDEWKSARLPALHAKPFMAVLDCFADSNSTLGSIPENQIAYSVMFDEAADAKAGLLEHNEHFPTDMNDCILSGPNIGVGNPFFKSVRSEARLNSDYDNIDLTAISKSYVSRCIYRRKCDKDSFTKRISNLPWGGKYHSVYRIAMRRMLNISGERTLMPTIIPPYVCHINGVYSIALTQKLSVLCGAMSSIPYDFYVKITGKTNGGYNIYSAFPMLDNSLYANAIALRTLLLNCLSDAYSKFWKDEYNVQFAQETWAKEDYRLHNAKFANTTGKWDESVPLRTDYERRQALIEIDVLVTMALGLNLRQLQMIYSLQFSVLKDYEADTWYDANGRIVFTNNRSLTGVGFSRPEFENPGAVQPAVRGTGNWDGTVKNAPEGYVFTRTITDDTQPGGPVQRTIEYVAPFDKCDREQDYETAWRFFEEKYGNEAQ